MNIRKDKLNSHDKSQSGVLRNSGAVRLLMKLAADAVSCFGAANELGGGGLRCGFPSRGSTDRAQGRPRTILFAILFAILPITFTSHFVHAASITLSTSSTTITEGNSGTKDVPITITLGQTLNASNAGFIVEVLSSSTATDNTNKASNSCTSPMPAGADFCYGGPKRNFSTDYNVTFIRYSDVQVYKLKIIGDTTDEEDETILVRVKPTSATASDFPAFLNVVSNTLTITIKDDDDPTVTVSKSELTVPEGGSGTYTMKLTTKPSGNVAVTVGGTSGDVSVTGSPLTFTTGNWSTAQTVTVNAEEDMDTAMDPDVTLTHSASGGGYSSATIASVTVSVTENDISVLGAPTSVAATGGNRHVVLSWKKPAGTVTGWKYQQKKGAGSYGSWVTMTGAGASATSYKVKPLDNGSAYHFKVRAVNAAGDGTASAEVSATPAAVAPVLTKAQSSGTEIRLEWTHAGGSNLDNYAYIPPGTGAVSSFSFFWKIFYRLKGATAWAERLNTSQQSGTNRRDMVFAPSGVSYIDGAVVEVRIRAEAISSRGGNTGPYSNTLEVTYRNPERLLLDRSRDSMVVAPGGSRTYAVALNFAHAGRVMLTSSDTAKATVTPSHLDFTAQNYSTAQTVTVSGVASASGDVTINHAFRLQGRSDTDAFPDVGTVSVKVSGTATPPPAKPAGFTATPGNRQVTLSWTDPGDSTITKWQYQWYTTPPFRGWTDIPSSGASTTTWTHTGRTNGILFGYRIRAVSPAGNGEVSEIRTVTPNPPGLTLSVSELTVAEEGSGVPYTVKLKTRPAGSVTVSVSGASGEVSASPAKLTFTTVNWNAAQTVTVSAGGDADARGDSATLVNSAGSEYGSVSRNVAVSVTDDDTEGVTLSVSELTVNEGSARTYTVQLATLPSGSVTVSVTGATGEVSASPTKLTFSTVNWNAAQTVTVSVGGDVDANDDTATLVNSAGGEYGSVSESLAVTVDDDDDDGLTLSASELTVAEGGSGTYTVKLDTLPSGSVTVTVSGASGEVSASPTKLTFTTVNWNAVQTVTVSAGGDDDAADDTATLVSSAGSEYASVSEELSVTVDDDDTEGVTLSVSGVTIAEGGTGTYTVKLDTLPSGSVTVTPSSDATAVATVSGALTFSTGNWNAEQTVTVTAEEDDDSADGTAEVSHAVAGYGSVTGGAVSVKVTDDDQLSTDLRKEHEGGIHELHVQFGQSMVGVANDIIVSRTSGAVSGRQNSMLIAGRQILFGPPHSSAVPLPPAYTDKPLRLDGDVELTRQRVDSVLDLLSDSSFNVSSATGQSSVEGGMTLWGRGGKTSFKRNGAGRSIDGSVTVGGIGFEFSQADWIGGLAYFRTRGKGNVTTTKDGDSAKSEEKVAMNSVHPYVHWQASEEVELWGTLGYGTGRADSRLQLADGSTEHRKGRMELLSALLGTRVSWDFDLAFKGEVSASRTTSKGLSATPMKSNQQQYKAVVEWSRLQALSDGGQLLPKVEAGVRYDDDSYSTGLSMVLAGSVRYTDADGRWSVEAGGSVLRSRASKRYRENGVYVGVELRSGANGFGPSMSIKATQGELVEALQSAWAESAIDGSESEREVSDGVGTQLEFGYGLAMGAGHMKPKVSVLLPAESGSRVYETGFEYRRGDRLSLELTHTHKPDADRGDGVRLGGSLRW